MEDAAILNLWKSYTNKLEESLELNRQNATAIIKMKVDNLLSSMKPIKIFTVIVGLFWVGFLDILITRLFFIANPFFLISAIIQVLLTKLAIGIYLYQLILIGQADSSGPVISTQEKLAKLQTSTLWIPRLLFLQLPLWTTFYWNRSMLTNGNMALYLLQALVTLSFTFIALWLFFNIKWENRNRKWFRLLFNGKEWTPVMKSIDLLHEVTAYKTENPGPEIQ